MSRLRDSIKAALSPIIRRQDDLDGAADAVLSIVEQLGEGDALWEWFWENCQSLDEHTNDGGWKCWHQMWMDSAPSGKTPREATQLAKAWREGLDDD